MGQGAMMTVVNNTSSPIQLFVENVYCMFDGGNQGSNLQAFNNVTVPPNGQVPTTGPQYIEDVDSGIPCAFNQAKFDLQVVDSEGNQIGTISFTEGGSKYAATTTNDDLLKVSINNYGPSDQSVINVTVI